MDDSSIPPAASEHPRAASQPPVVQLEWQVLDAYLAGKATPEEQVQVGAWAGASEVNQRFIDVLHDPATHDVMHADVEARWKEFRAGVPAVPEPRERTTVSLPYPEGMSSRRRGHNRGFSAHVLRRWLWLGGMTAAAAGLIFFARRRSEMPADVTRVYATVAEQQAVLNLADGTRVTLAPRTTLKLRHFGAQSRTVELEGGEAYFEVAHTSGAPFIVRSGTATAQVLGTAFLVRHTVGDSRVRVSVADGKVRLALPERRNADVTLVAGHIGDITDSTVVVSTVDDLTQETEWLRGRLVFRRVSVGTVLQALNRWYGYQFRCSDSTLTQQQVTISLSARSSAAALSTLEQYLSVHLTVVGDTVTLTPHVSRTGLDVSRKQAYDVWIPTREAGR